MWSLISGFLSNIVFITVISCFILPNTVTSKSVFLAEKVISKTDTGPNCHMCEVMLNNVRYEYKFNFTDVTVDQLKHSLYLQCDLYLNGFTDQECHTKVDQDSPDILQQLKDGKTSYRICQQEQFCS